MPRRARSIVGGYAYHLLNRANARLRLFKKDEDFAAFEQVLWESLDRVPLRILGYVLMSNHWHFVVWPRQRRDSEVSEFFRWLTLTHSQRWHAHHGTSGMGHVYQGRFKSFPIAADEHLLKVLRYVERKPLRAGLVSRAEDWRWGCPSPPPISQANRIVAMIDQNVPEDGEQRYHTGLSDCLADLWITSRSSAATPTPGRTPA